MSKNLVSEKSLSFGFGKLGLGRKVSVSVLEKFGIGKKSRFRFRKIWIRKKVSVSVSEKFGLGKKSRFRKIWYRKKSLGIGFGQNFCIVIQCTSCLSQCGFSHGRGMLWRRKDGNIGNWCDYPENVLCGSRL